MADQPSIQPTAEKAAQSKSGWGMLALGLLMVAGSIALFVGNIVAGETGGYTVLQGALIPVAVVLFIAGLVLLLGLFIVQPNMARVMVFFGDYRGTEKREGMRWVNPFTTKKAISLRARTLNGEHLKVNDKLGNPIEIANVVVWHVGNTARATFDVENYESFVAAQSESALRHVASLYAYDHMDASDAETHEITLRSNMAEVSAALKEELQRNLDVAGVVVDEARITHLAYAPEIAQAMLRRQQADAVIAAREKIVRGAVDMVEMALTELSDKHVVELDNERRAAMVSNLLVVLCGESDAQPVLNTGTLYQ